MTLDYPEATGTAKGDSHSNSKKGGSSEYGGAGASGAGEPCVAGEFHARCTRDSNAG